MILFSATGYVKPGESMFRNALENVEIMEDEYTPIFIDDLEFTEEQKELCKDDLQCLYDLVITGEKDIAMDTLATGEEVEQTQAILGKVLMTI